VTFVGISRMLRSKSWRSCSRRSKISFARARFAGGSATPLSSKPSIRSFLSFAWWVPTGFAALTRAKSFSFWKSSVENVVYFCRQGSEASRTAFSGWTLPRR
jgi:hypothetical protein